MASYRGMSREMEFFQGSCSKEQGARRLFHFAGRFDRFPFQVPRKKCKRNEKASDSLRMGFEERQGEKRSWHGRSQRQTRILENVSEISARIFVRREIVIELLEVPKTNWGSRGGGLVGVTSFFFARFSDIEGVARV